MRCHFCSISFKSLLSLVLLANFSFPSLAQTYSLSGTVITAKNTPVESAVVLLPQSDQWAMADAKGNFTVQNVAKGKVQVTVSCLGYVAATYELEIRSDTTGVKLYLQRDNLVLDNVEVTAKINENSATTSRTIDRTAMDHMQMVNVADLMGLLPGGKTIDPNLAGSSSPRFEIRTGGET